MAEYLSYKIYVEVDGAEFTLHPSEMRIEMKDSIHNFYSTATLTVEDVTGILNEYGMFINGMPVNILFGRKSDDENFLNYYVVESSSINELKTPGLLAGTLEVELKHQFCSVQTRESEALDGENSEFVEALIEDGEFEETNVESTNYSRIWYRPLLTQAEMINDVLCEKAFSSNAEGTPFFCFINSENKFNYRSYENLFGSESVVELHVRPETPEEHSVNTIEEIYPLSPEYTLRPWKHRQYWMTEEGELENEEKDLTELTTIEGMPPVMADSELLTSYDYEWLEEEEPNRESTVSQALKKSLFLKRYVAYLPLNTHLVAGKTVNLSIIHYSENGRELSPAHSGKYLIEASKHTWNGPNQQTSTELILSRPRDPYPSNYLIGGKVYGA